MATENRNQSIDYFRVPRTLTFKTYEPKCKTSVVKMSFSYQWLRTYHRFETEFYKSNSEMAHLTSPNVEVDLKKKKKRSMNTSNYAH